MKMKLPLYEFVFVITLAVCVGIYNVLFEDPWDAIDASDYRHLNLIPQRPPIPRSNNVREQAKETNSRYDKEAE